MKTINDYIKLDLYKIDYKQVLNNYSILIIGLFIMSFGVALSVRSNLGTTPISCIPYVLSFKFPLSLGTITILFNTLLIIIQILILRSKFPKIQLLQIIVNFIFGYFIDFSLYLTINIIPTSYVMQWFICFISCIIITLGVFFEVNSHAIVLPGEGVSLAIHSVTHTDFGKLKTYFDTTNVILGVIMSLIFFGTFKGVGLGTIFAGVVVGCIVRFYRKLFLLLTNKHQ